jgi:predicted nucleic acid-binding protein
VKQIVKPVLLDSGCIVALLDRSERYHEPCVEAVNTISGALVTCEAVIAESCYLLRSLPSAVDAILDNVEQGIFEIPFRLSACSKPVRALLKRYASVPMDFADACLVCMANELDTARILTLDRDFEVYRWRKARTFDLLVELE